MNPINSIDARTGEVRGAVALPSSAEQIDAAVVLATAAGAWLTSVGRDGRARLLESLARALEAEKDELVDIADRETALGTARLESEIARTCYQLRFMGEVAVEGSYLNASIEHPGSTPAGPRPDLRTMNVAIGPVAVFGSSNFPFAFSAPGGDTASALAAGCPVIVKAHSAHAELSRRIAEIFADVLRENDAPAGVFQVVFGREAGVALVRHPGIRAVGFTGSVAGGRALFDEAAGRADPIPFYGELGSVNPLIVTPAAAAARGPVIGEGIAASMTLGAGQFCTKPGLFLVPGGGVGDALVERLVNAVSVVPSASLLTEGIFVSFTAGTRRVTTEPGIRVLHDGERGNRTAAPVLVEIDADDFRGSVGELLAEEYFGPFGAVVRYDSLDQLEKVFSSLPPALTGTVHSDGVGDGLLEPVTALLESRAGRVVFDGYPTGVAIAWGMNHGGQYPASTSNQSSVGATSIARWLRPVAYQNAPASVLPAELRDGDAQIPRRVDGHLRLPHGDLDNRS